MKKILIAILLLVSAYILFAPEVYATTPPTETEISDELMWTRAANGGYYYVQSNRFLIDFSSVEMEFNTTLGDWEEAFVATAGAYSSVVEIFNDDDPFSNPIKTFTIAYEAPEVTEVLFLFDDGVMDFNVDTNIYMNKYMQITLMLNPDPPAGLITNVQHWMNNYRNQYDFRIYTFREVLLDQTIADLPVTAGNPFQAGHTGIVWDWNYDNLTGTFGAKVQYFQEYNLAIPNVGFTDSAFLDRVESIDYYTIDGEKFFQFNFEDNHNVLLTGSGQFAKPWNGFALWNLTTNEFIQYNKALALTYIEVTDTRQVFAYLYLPGINMDHVLNVSGSIDYRYGYKNFFGTQKYHDWETAVFSLEKDEQSYGSQSFFEGTLPQWGYDVLAYSIPAFAAGAILSMVPGLQVIGVPLLVGGVAGIVASNVAAIQFVKTGLTDEIQTITPTAALRTKLNDHYTLASGSLTVLPTNAQVHKLFIGTFTKTGTNVVEPNASTLVYTEITWATSGQVYTLDQKFIDSEAILDQDYQNNLPPEGSGGWWDDIFGDASTAVIGILIVIGVLYFLPTLDKGVNSLSNILKQPRKLLIVAAIVFVLLIITGVIRI